MLKTTTTKILFSLLTLIVIAPQTSKAQLTFTSVTESQLNDIMKDFSANFAHTSVSPSAALGTLWGFELGLIASQTSAAKTKAVVDSITSNTFDGKLYAPGLLGRVTAPLGFTGELEIIPSTSFTGGSVSYNSIALAWDASKTVLSGLPIDLGLKAYSSTFDFSFTQTFTSPPNTTGTVSLKNTITGLQAFVSKDFLVAQPYLGVGIASASGSLGTSAGTNLFNSTFTTSSSATTKLSSTHIAMGAELKLFIFKLGLEYASLFDTSRYSAKFAFYF